MPRIAHVISVEGDRIGGTARVMLALLDGGRERGWAQMVLNPYASTERGLADHCEGIPYQTLTPHRVSAFPRARRWLRRELRGFRPDIVHAHLTHALVTVASLRRPRLAARILTHHHERHLLAEGRNLAARLDRAAGRRFDRVVAVAEPVRQFLLDEYGYPPSKVACITNGWSGTPLPKSRADRPTVVCVANFRPEKGHAILLEAFGKIRERVPAARLVLVGGGPLLEQVQGQTAALGLDEDVEFTGPVGDVWPILADAQVFALPSVHETLGIAVLEAMAAGLPVVASAVRGPSDIVEPGATGFLSPPGEPAPLAEYLTTLLTDAQLRDRIGQAARAAAQEHTMDQCVDRYFEFYEALLRHGAGSG